MPIERPLPVAHCVACNAQTTFVENDIDDEEDDSGLPPGWTIIQARRVVTNTEYLREKAEQEKAMAVLGQTIPEDAPEAMRQAAMAETYERTEPQSAPYIAEEIEEATCPEHSNLLQTRLGAADWAEGGGL